MRIRAKPGQDEVRCEIGMMQHGCGLQRDLHQKQPGMGPTLSASTQKTAGESPKRHRSPGGFRFEADA